MYISHSSDAGESGMVRRHEHASVRAVGRHRHRGWLRTAISGWIGALSRLARVSRAARSLAAGPHSVLWRTVEESRFILIPAAEVLYFLASLPVP